MRGCSHERVQAEKQLLFKLFLVQAKPVITKGPNKACLFYSKEYAGGLIRCTHFTIFNMWDIKYLKDNVLGH